MTRAHLTIDRLRQCITWLAAQQGEIPRWLARYLGTGHIDCPFCMILKQQRDDAWEHIRQQENSP